jgi:hypothetical protein
MDGKAKMFIEEFPLVSIEIARNSNIDGCAHSADL